MILYITDNSVIDLFRVYQLEWMFSYAKVRWRWTQSIFKKKKKLNVFTMEIQSKTVFGTEYISVIIYMWVNDHI